MYNLIHTVKMDEVGKLIEFTCRDADGTVDLTNYTVTMTLKKGSTVVTSAASVTKKNQTTDEGECYHTWTAATIPNAAGTYKGELKATYGSNVLYFPCDANSKRTYFEVIVQEALE